MVSYEENKVFWIGPMVSNAIIYYFSGIDALLSVFFQVCIFQLVYFWVKQEPIQVYVGVTFNF